MQSISTWPHARGPDGCSHKPTGPASMGSPSSSGLVNGNGTTNGHAPRGPSSSSHARSFVSTRGPPSASASVHHTAGLVFRGPLPRQYQQQQHSSALTSSASGLRRATPTSSSPFSLFFGAAATRSSSTLKAEVKPTPLDGGTAALRELNTSYPSNVYRHRLTKSAGAQSTTYSQPVIVRTYSGPIQRDYYRGSRSGSRPYTVRTPLPPPPPPQTNGSAVHTTANGNGHSESTGNRNGVVDGLWTSKPPNMPRHPPPPPPSKRRFPLALPWQWGGSSDEQGTTSQAGGSNSEPPKYPPPEAFTMKGIIQSQRAQRHNELDKSLDQIAELYARSRYSLANQYEVHVTPHGSGTDFVSGASAPARRGTGGPPSSRGGGGNRRPHQLVGPTLQASWSGDEGDESSAVGGGIASSSSSAAVPPRPHRKRRSGVAAGKRKSAAYGTLETIMSSSRSNSSEEKEKQKKKSANELTEDVRGRAERSVGHRHTKSEPVKGRGRDGAGSTGTAQTRYTAKGRKRAEQDAGASQRNRASTSFVHAIITADSPRNSASALVSEPALPQTTTYAVSDATSAHEGAVITGENQTDEASATGGSMGSHGWLPWRGPATSESQASRARDGLRDLLKGAYSVNSRPVKVKGPSREG
ncbi:hypothetical protein MCOR27_003449 [Pyricularia oryzae]|uniref:Uncharacterized protein n=1 Tax=Pyricularia grisea TaxID=148305 RepID=A0ABQ8NE96_PYRGI|nr:hypothetical protein MCOR01_009108 [Pyricularia oryzae]KAI6295597.1 hypothetical protein MCOR33_007531 [Pyricularia grisea]KAH9439798.1 hypothetical protein MCOR02_003336 [Pyricularia oryzae]KAI6270483.1 hypothetical protein MCOR26_008223 [Pyricularia oryzae]KAI6283097.1 hypothetical protein MCOR27_003449 [Pyricularia oryzae]